MRPQYPTLSHNATQIPPVAPQTGPRERPGGPKPRYASLAIRGGTRVATSGAGSCTNACRSPVCGPGLQIGRDSVRRRVLDAPRRGGGVCALPDGVRAIGSRSASTRVSAAAALRDPHAERAAPARAAPRAPRAPRPAGRRGRARPRRRSPARGPGRPRPAAGAAVSSATGAGSPGPSSMTSIRTRPCRARAAAHLDRPLPRARSRWRSGCRWPGPAAAGRPTRAASSPTPAHRDAAPAAAARRPATPRRSRPRSCATSTASSRHSRRAPPPGAREVVERERRPAQLGVDRPQPRRRRRLVPSAGAVEAQPGGGQRPAQLVTRARDGLHPVAVGARARSPPARRRAPAATQPATDSGRAHHRAPRRAAGSRRPTR